LTAVIALSTLSTVSSSYSKKWIKSEAGWVTQDNVAYPGGDLEGNEEGKGWPWPDDTEDKDKTAEACRALCKENKANFFTFRKTSKNCWCKWKKGKAGPKPDEDAISGTSDGCDSKWKSDCNRRRFRCENGEQIDDWEVCDTDDDCGDDSDEKFCGDNCGGWDGFFRCNDGQCQPMYYTCDAGENGDCSDGEDEAKELCDKNCGGNTQMFQCDNGECVNKSYMCDGDQMCEDGSDEAEELCRVNCGGNPYVVQCDNGECIWESDKCHSEYGCKDGSRKEGCPA